MKRSVSAMEARKRFGELLEEVYYRGDDVIIEIADHDMVQGRHHSLVKGDVKVLSFPGLKPLS